MEGRGERREGGRGERVEREEVRGWRVEKLIEGVMRE